MNKKLKTIFGMINKLNYILDKKTKRSSIFVFANILVAALLETLGVSAIIPFIQAMINPEEIATMDVLKDKSATAVYGEKGKNGVIIINLKKRKIMKTIKPCR